MNRRAGSISWCLIAACILAATAAAEEDGPLPLPHWTLEEITGMRHHPAQPPALGELLGTPDGTEEPPPLEGNEVVGDSPERSQPSADLSRFLPLSLLQRQRSHPLSSTRTAMLSDVSVEFLRQCEELPPVPHLIDPAHELSETTSEDLARFLAYHANDSTIALNLLVIGRHQKLPEAADVGGMAGGSVARGYSALLVVPYGETARTRLFVSHPILEALPADYLKNLLDDCLQDAQQASDPDEQMHRLLVRLSIRLFWMQRMIAPAVSAPAPLLTPRTTLGEIIRPAVIEKQAAKPWAAALPWLLALVLASYIGWRWHRYRLRHFQWLLPEMAARPSPRFGGAACGGGVAIKYR